ncbi:hypothetical protein ACSEOM_30890, partial [Pseudomonas aeruginosa]
MLSKWLSQIGSRTWTGSLSQEGIQQMRSELAKAASKTSAVAVFAVRSGRRMVTGQQTHLSDPTAKGDGVHLFKWTPLLA